jgi:hypothetical protein
MRRALVLVILVLALFTGCQRDYRFTTVAVYAAPHSACTIRLETRGIVRAGADVSRESTGTLTLRREPPGAPALRLPLVLGDDGPRIDGEPAATAPLGARLAQSGCTPEAGELKEIRSAIEGALSGPKGTLMAGQTKVLKVTSVQFDR